jgi:serine/threonine protein kinase
VAQLKHMHIVLVLEFGIERATPFLVMDYAPKGTLRQAHPRGSALPLPLVVTYVKQIAAALQYAHDAKLIHRDVKPENILLGSYGEVLLSDFGIAVTAHHTSSLKTLDHAGTPPYMAPELIQGKPRPASDQYALGIVVYEWLCGERPFQGGSSALSAHRCSPAAAA